MYNVLLVMAVYFLGVFFGYNIGKRTLQRKVVVVPVPSQRYEDRCQECRIYYCAKHDALLNGAPNVK